MICPMASCIGKQWKEAWCLPLVLVKEAKVTK